MRVDSPAGRAETPVNNQWKTRILKNMFSDWLLTGFSHTLSTRAYIVNNNNFIQSVIELYTIRLI